MTDAKLLSETEEREIPERAEKATPGPWRVSDENAGRMIRAYAGQPVATLLSSLSSNFKDAHFIAHAREDIPRLLATLDAVRAELAAVRAPASAPARHADMAAVVAAILDAEQGGKPLAIAAVELIAAAREQGAAEALRAERARQNRCIAKYTALNRADVRAHLREAYDLDGYAYDGVLLDILADPQEEP